MLNSIEAHRKGMDAASDHAKEMLNEILGVQCPNLGAAMAEVTFLKRKYDRLKQDYEELQTELKERSDWK